MIIEAESGMLVKIMKEAVVKDAILKNCNVYWPNFLHSQKYMESV